MAAVPSGVPATLNFEVGSVGALVLDGKHTPSAICRLRVRHGRAGVCVVAAWAGRLRRAESAERRKARAGDPYTPEEAENRAR